MQSEHNNMQSEHNNMQSEHNNIKSEHNNMQSEHNNKFISYETVDTKQLTPTCFGLPVGHHQVVLITWYKVRLHTCKCKSNTI
jgi:hypothetical protein